MEKTSEKVSVSHFGSQVLSLLSAASNNALSSHPSCCWHPQICSTLRLGLSCISDSKMPNPCFVCFSTSNGRARKLGSCIKHLRWTSWNIQTFGLFGDPNVLSWNMEETSTNSWDFNPSEMKLVWSICKHVLSIHCDVSIIRLFTSSMTWGYVYFDQDCNVVGTTSISVLQKIQCLRCSSIVAEKESCIQTVSKPEVQRALEQVSFLVAPTPCQRQWPKPFHGKAGVWVTKQMVRWSDGLE